VGAVALRLTNGCKRYGSAAHAPVFHAVDLDLRPGELIVLLGPSGCGKSTLLRCLAGLEPLSSGDLNVDGGDNGAAVGVVFQEPRLMPWLTVRQNVGLGLRYRRNRAAAAEAAASGAVDRLLQELGLAALANARSGELSGGQAQRVSLARAMIVRPRVLLLDEPFAALDPRTRAGLQDWLLARRRADGLSVVLVTHDVDEALRLGDRLALFSARPGSITHRWTIDGHGAGSPAETLRAEILRCYDDDLSRQNGRASEIERLTLPPDAASLSGSHEPQRRPA